MSASQRWQRWGELLVEVADRADEISLGFFRSSGLRTQVKADDSPVTEADRAIEALARGLAKTRCPELGVLGEEEGESGSRDCRLIVDPIDSTRNFLHGIPIFATLLAVEEDGEVVSGLVSAPALRCRWHAIRGEGAYRNGTPIRVSGTRSLSRAQLFHGDLIGSQEPPPPGRLESLVGVPRRARGFGDFYQHVLVAQGSGEAAIDPKVSPWDAAPLLLLVEEAGGRATAMSGVRSIYAGSLVSTNGLVHEELLRHLERPERGEERLAAGRHTATDATETLAGRAPREEASEEDSIEPHGNGGEER